jgi:tetratricopeptide (TPR) repeat protein
MAVVLAYLNSLTAPFIFDDDPAITDNKTIRQLWPLGEVLRPPSTGGTAVSGRPIVNLSLAINYAISGTEPWSYHLANLLIHAGATLALFGLVRRALLGPVLHADWGRHAEKLAFAAALLWALHPLQTESVTCVIQRTESLVGLLYLLTLYCFARATGADLPPGRRLIWGLASITACALGMATKEVMVTAPVLVLLYDRTFVGGSFRSLWRHRWLHYGLLATWALLFYLLQGNPLRGGTASYELITPWQYLLTQCRAIVLYLKLSVWPHPLVLDYGTAHARRLAEVWPQALFLVALATGTLWACWRRPVLGFLGAWFFLILSPSSSVVPLVTQTIAEHRMYLPLAAVILLGAGLLVRRAPDALLPTSLVLALVFAVMTVARNRLYHAPTLLWQENLRHAPQNPRAHAGLARSADKAGKFAEAVAHYENYLHARPDDLDARFNYGRDLVKVGRREEALREFETVLAAHPADTAARINYATALLSLRRTPEAVRQFEIIIRFAPDAGQNHFNLAEAYMTADRLADAIESYGRAARMLPDNGFVHYRYADALLRAGRVPEAIDSYRTAVKLQPELYEAWTNLGGALLMLERPGEALPAYEAALGLQPNNPQARENLDYTRSLLR